MLLNEVEILLTCNDCKQQDNIVDIPYRCETCQEKIDEDDLKNIFPELMDYIELHKKFEIEGDMRIGFNSEEDKKNYLQGLKMGMEEALMNIAMFYEECGYGNDMWKKYEKMKSEFSNQKVIPTLCEPDKSKCEHCQGKGYTNEQG